jgi:hypothetical protein
MLKALARKPTWPRWRLWPITDSMRKPERMRDALGCQRATQWSFLSATEDGAAGVAVDRNAHRAAEVPGWSGLGAAACSGNEESAGESQSTRTARIAVARA